MNQLYDVIIVGGGLPVCLLLTAHGRMVLKKSLLSSVTANSAVSCNSAFTMASVCITSRKS